MDIEQLRNELDATDAQLIALFTRRMELCAQIGQLKALNGIAVYDAQREHTKLCTARALAAPGLEEYTAELTECLMQLSKQYQTDINEGRKNNG